MPCCQINTGLALRERGDGACAVKPGKDLEVCCLGEPRGDPKLPPETLILEAARNKEIMFK